MSHFGKIMELERELLKKTVRELEKDLEKLSDNLGMKEEELIVWEGTLRDTLSSNESKLMLARQALSMKNGGSPSNRARLGGGSPSGCFGMPRRNSRSGRFGAIPLAPLAEDSLREEEEDEQEEKEEEDESDGDRIATEDSEESPLSGRKYGSESPTSRRKSEARDPGLWGFVVELLKTVEEERMKFSLHWEKLEGTAEEVRHKPPGSGRLCAVHRIDALLTAFQQQQADAAAHRQLRQRSGSGGGLPSAASAESTVGARGVDGATANGATPPDAGGGESANSTGSAAAKPQPLFPQVRVLREEARVLREKGRADKSAAENGAAGDGPDNPALLPGSRAIDENQGKEIRGAQLRSTEARGRDGLSHLIRQMEAVRVEVAAQKEVLCLPVQSRRA